MQRAPDNIHYEQTDGNIRTVAKIIQFSLIIADELFAMRESVYGRAKLPEPFVGKEAEASKKLMG